MSSYSDQPWLQHYRVSADLSIPQHSMIDVFEATARRQPEAPAIYHFDSAISFGELDLRGDRFAAQLASWKIGKGDRVALQLQNDPEFVIAQLGAWKRGAIVVPLNPMLKEREMRFHLDDSSSRILICSDTPDYDPGTEHILTARELSDLCSMDSDQDPAAVRLATTADDIAYLVYTSGTTGEPKGAICLHRNVAFNAEAYRSWLSVNAGDVILGLAPLFHVTGLVAQLALSATAGIPLVLFGRFDAGEVLRLARKWNTTISVAAITAYIALINHADGSSLPLTKCYSGGAPVASAVVEEFERRFGVYVHNIYGLTESNSPSHGAPLGTRAPVDEASGALSIGVPIPYCSAKIVDPQNADREVPVGEAGELALSGPMIFAGYWERPDASASAFRNGFFLTGDIAVMDESGWFYLIDRKKDMIIASGYKIWPREVEDILYQHPQVREAAVVGIPDEYRGETVKAFVSLKSGTEASVQPGELIEFCRERMAAYKYPRQVEIVAEIPKTLSGKILRRALRPVPSLKTKQGHA